MKLFIKRFAYVLTVCFLGILIISTLPSVVFAQQKKPATNKLDGTKKTTTTTTKPAPAAPAKTPAPNSAKPTQAKPTVPPKTTAKAKTPAKTTKPTPVSDIRKNTAIKPKVTKPAKPSSENEVPEKALPAQKVTERPLEKTGKLEKKIDEVREKMNNIMHYTLPDSTRQFARQLFHKNERDSLYYKERDIVELFFVKSPDNQEKRRERKLYVTFFPAAGLSPTSSLYFTLISNAAFYMGPMRTTNLSAIDFSPVYSFNKEFILPIKSVLWAKDNKYNIITDWRISNYPEYTYGLGSNTPISNKTLITHSFVKLHQSVQQRFLPNWFAGVGYYFDKHSTIEELSPSDIFPSAYGNYGFVQHATVSSGLAFNLQSNTRKNPINPTSGRYFRTVFRWNMGLLGSTINWQELYGDYRRYFKPSKTSPNILAVNTLTWFTFGSQIPYFDLPYIGGDAYGRTGRGYSPGRYRGQHMLYGEAEYRFRIMPNGLLGSVVFLNLSCFSEPSNGAFKYILPGFGSGLRIKLDKRSNANMAIDLGFGVQGSWDVRFNIGEVF